MKGFTLIEMITVVAILAILGTVGMLSFTGFQRDPDLTVSTEKIVGTLREAQTRSMAGEQTSTWGVHFDTTVPAASFFSFFHGASYGSATTTMPTYLSFNLRFSNITINGGGADILFNRLTGSTSQYGTGASNQALCITTSEETSACKKSIRVSPVGRIDWQ